MALSSTVVRLRANQLALLRSRQTKKPACLRAPKRALKAFERARSNVVLLSITTEWRRQGIDRLDQSLDVAEPVGEPLHLPAVVGATRLVVRIDAVRVALLCQDLDNPRLVDVSLVRPAFLEF